MHEPLWGLNAVDLLMAVVISAVVFLGKKDGVVTEFFKLFGVLCAVFISLHYYGRLADLLRKQFFREEASTECLSFVLLVVPVIVAFVFISKGWTLILKIQTIKSVDRWGSLILSLVSGYFLCGLLLVGLLLSQNELAVSLSRTGMSRNLFRNSAVGFYRSFSSGVIEKYFPGEKINTHVFKLMDEHFGSGKVFSGK